MNEWVIVLNSLRNFLGLKCAVKIFVDRGKSSVRSIIRNAWNGNLHHIEEFTSIEFAISIFVIIIHD